MEPKYTNDTPLIFSDGTDVYEKLKKEYVTHEKGFFIYGPSGVGKTYYVNHQKVKNWMDGWRCFMECCKCFSKR